MPKCLLLPQHFSSIKMLVSLQTLDADKLKTSFEIICSCLMIFFFSFQVVLKHGFVIVSLPPTLSVDKDDSGNKTPSCGLVQNFASLLLAASCFHRQKWEQCREHALRVSHPLWNSVATLLAGVCVFVKKI